MKYAIIISGNYRTWDQCKTSFVETFANLDFDLFISTYNLRYDYHPYIKSRLGDAGDELVSLNKICDSLSEFSLCGVSYESSQVVQDIYHDKFAPNFRNIGNPTFAQVRKLRLAGDLIKNHEERQNFKYDIIIKTRFDLQYYPIDFTRQSANSIIFDSGNVYPNDCIYITARDNMFNLFETMHDEFYTQQDSESHRDPPHGLLRSAIRYHNLEELPAKIMRCVVRKGNIYQSY